MDRARRFGPALACPIDTRLAVIHLRFDRARDPIGVDESRLRVGVGRKGRARRVIDLHGEQRVAAILGMADSKFFVTVCARYHGRRWGRPSRRRGWRRWWR